MAFVCDTPTAPSDPRRMMVPEDVSRFILAGASRFTLRSAKTGTRYTYRVKRAKPKDGVEQEVWFVSVLWGPDNEQDYQYAGILTRDSATTPLYFKSTPKSRISGQAPSVSAFKWVWDLLVQKNALHPQLEFWHEGRCGKCARTLTVPESVERGIGPECAKAFGLL